MDILEFQSKILCREFGIPVPDSILLTSIHPIQHNLIDLNFPLVMKAQVPSHKRARRGGICLARSSEEAISMLSSMFIRKIDDYQVNRILIEEMIEFHSGFAVSLKYDLNDFTIILSVSESFTSLEGNGGKGDQDKNAIKYKIDPFIGILDSTISEVSALLELDSAYWLSFKAILSKIWKLFADLELQYLEVNPLVVGADSMFFVLGIDIGFDDRALFRHPEMSRFVEFVPADEFGDTMRKLDCGYTRFEGKCCVISASLEMGGAIRDILISAGQEASELISFDASVTSEAVTQLLHLVENEKRSDCIILHMIDGQAINDKIVRSIKSYQSASQHNLPIIIRMNGFEKKNKQKLENSDHLIIVHSLAEIPGALYALTQGKI